MRERGERGESGREGGREDEGLTLAGRSEAASWQEPLCLQLSWGGGEGEDQPVAPSLVQDLHQLPLLHGEEALHLHGEGLHDNIQVISVLLCG